MIAAANFTYLIGISLPSVAVLLLRRNEPERDRPYRAPRGTIGLGVGAGGVWLLATCLGFEQFGLPTVLLSLGLAYAGSIFYAWRLITDRRRAGLPGIQRSLQPQAHRRDGGRDGARRRRLPAGRPAPSTPATRRSISLLQDIFVAVAILTITVGLVLPGHHRPGGRADLRGRRAPRHRHAGRPDARDAARSAPATSTAAKARVDVVPVDVRSRDEVGELARSFNLMQEEVGRAAEALDGAREGLRATEAKLERNLAQQTAVARLGRLALEGEDLRSLLQETVLIGRAVLGADLSATIAASPDGRGLGEGPSSPRGPAGADRAAARAVRRAAGPAARGDAVRARRDRLPRGDGRTCSPTRSSAAARRRRCSARACTTRSPACRTARLFMDRLSLDAQPGRAPPGFGRRAVHRPRPLQARQRLARPRRRRRAPVPAGRAADRGAAPGRHRRALRRRRVLRDLRRPRRSRAGDRHRPADDRGARPAVRARRERAVRLGQRRHRRRRRAADGPRRTSSARPTRRCTAPRRTGAAASSSSTRSCAATPASACGSRTTCAARSRPATS